MVHLSVINKIKPFHCIVTGLVLIFGVAFSKTDNAQGALNVDCNVDKCSYLPLTSRPTSPISVTVVYAQPLRIPNYAVVGYITSTQGSPTLYGVTLTVRLYNGLGTLLDTFSGAPTYYATLPNQINPFQIGRAHV